MVGIRKMRGISSVVCRQDGDCMEHCQPHVSEGIATSLGSDEGLDRME